MQFLPFIIAAGSLPLISGAPVASNLYSVSADTESTHSLSGRSTNLYAAVFGGDGLVSQGWPSTQKWVADFEDMWANNLDDMKSSCSPYGYGDDNSEEEISHIKKAIQQVASDSSVDSRYILAIMMQESKGCVRVKTTNYGYDNPGLMQSHEGKHSCNDASGKNPTSPCPYETIHGMISDGTVGTSGLKTCMATYNAGDDSTTYYKAARCYNSGHVDTSGNLGLGGATACYVSDIVNRLLGWSSGPSSCSEADIGSLTTTTWDGQSDSDSGSSGGSGSSGTTSSSSSIPAATETFTPSTIAPTAVQTAQPTAETTAAPAPTTTETPAPVAPTTTAAPTVAPSSASEPAPSSSLAPGGNYGPYPYASKSCQQYYTVEANDYCRKIEVQYGITFTDLQSLNPGLDNTCSNLWKGYQYCIKA